MNRIFFPLFFPFFRVFPARAGMNRVDLPQRSRARGVPRASGDEPDDWKTTAPSPMCSPRERG